MRKADDAVHNFSKVCITWPVYANGIYRQGITGESMLALTEDEKRALQIIVLRTNVQSERYGANHQLNWKKVGLSRAYFKSELVCESNMPTARAKAALRWLTKENPFYQVGYHSLIE